MLRVSIEDPDMLKDVRRTRDTCTFLIAWRDSVLSN